MAVCFKECGRDRVDELRQFFAEMYSPRYVLSADAGFLCWMFGDTPIDRGDDLNVILALVDGRIRGCVGYIPVEITAGGRIVRGAWAANWMVDPEQRRLGLGPLLMRELSSRFELTLATGPNEAAADLLPRMGWTAFGSLPRYVRMLDERAAAVLLNGGAAGWPVADRHPDKVGSVQNVPYFGAEVDDLWDRLTGADLSGTRRSAAYLNWRYAAHPRFQHRLFTAADDGALTGFAVYRVEQVRDMPIRVGRVLELVGADTAADRALLQNIAEDARTEGVALIDFFCSSARPGPALLAEGFLPDSDPRAADVPMLFQPLDRRRAGIVFVADLRKARDVQTREWYVTKSDGDQDRPS